MAQRKIIHIDMDCFFAAVEMREEPSLKNIPMAVGGKAERRGVLCTANYEARKYGVRSALSTGQAYRLCPQLKVVPVNFPLYKKESKAIFEIFRRFTDIIQPISLDEAFLDVTDCSQFHGSGTLIAQEIRRLIEAKRGITASAGIAPNKFIAKIASDWQKPNGQTVITPEKVDGFMRKLPIEKIWGVGKSTAKKMHHLGLYSCSDIQQLSLIELHNFFGNFGDSLYELSRGIDTRPVSTDRQRKSYTKEHTFEHDLNHQDCASELKNIFINCLQHLEAFLQNNSEYRIKSTVTKIKFSDFKSTTVESISQNFSWPIVQELLQEGLQRNSMKVRLLGCGVKFYDGENDFQQMKLF